MAKKRGRGDDAARGKPARRSASDVARPPDVKSSEPAGGDSEKGRGSAGERTAQSSFESSASDVAGQPEFPIVGMGASAGGLDAFKKFFNKLPVDSGAAFVLVPHLDPTHESLMVELLARQTRLPVCEAGDDMPVEPNHVYVIPPNNDLTNLITSSEIAMVFLDHELRIKRFTPHAGNLLNLRATDLDRPFRDFAPNFDDEALLDDCRAVLAKLVPIEKEVWTRSDEPGTASRQKVASITVESAQRSRADAPRPRCFLRRILPYRTADNRIDGVVIALVDITQRVEAEAQSRRLATVLWDSNDAVTVQDFDGRILAWNRGAERMYGYTEAEALQMNIRDTVPEDKRTEALAYVQCLVRDEPVTVFETQRVTKDGRILEVELTATAYRDELGRSIGVATTERDITPRKELTRDLQRLNETLEQRVADKTREVRLLAEAVSHLGEGVVITADGLAWPGPQIVFANEAMSRITGYSSDELVGQTPRILQGKDTDRNTLDRIKSELAAGHSCLVELINYRKDGTPYDAELFITPLLDAAGRRTNYVSIHRDITARKQADQTLRASEEHMRAILTTASDAFITIDRHGIILTVNRATERMFDYTREELIGHNVNLLMPAPYHDEHDGYIARYLRTGEARIIGIGREVIALRKDGSTFPVDLAVSEVDHTGLFTGIIRDISLRKELQKQVLEISADERRRIGQELHDGTGQELTGLSLFADTLAELLDHAPQRATDGKRAWLLDEAELTRLRQTASRLSRGLVEANRHVKQICHGIMPVQIEPEGLRSALEILAAEIDAQQKVSCQFDCPQSVTVADNSVATHLFRITQEAINNSIKHGRADQIRISLTRSNGEIILEVSDNGSGFDPASLPRSSDPGRTHGFGLEIMNYRAGMIGGTLRVTRRDEGGTRVRVTAPEGRGGALG